MIKTIICDDEEATIIILTKLIKTLSLPLEVVKIANNGEKAIEYINLYKPDLIFLDIEMPIYNGFQVMQKIKDTSVIIITAYDTFEYARKALRLGAKDILIKPIAAKDLKISIERAVGWNITKDPLVNGVLEYIHKNYMKDINLQKISEELFCSPNHLSRVFKKRIGITVMNYIHKIRIENSIQKLNDSTLPIQNIAIQVGYNNLNNFYKHFKLITKNTPFEFRKKKRL